MSAQQAIVVAYQDLADAVTLVKPFVGTDDTLPMLTGIRFEVTDGVLTLAATDRYALGLARIRQTDDELPAFKNFSALIPLKDLVRVLTLFKPPRSLARYSSPLLVTVEDKWVTFEVSDPGSDQHGSRMRFRVIDAQFPPIKPLVGPLLAGLREAKDRVPYTSLNAEFLARFAAVSKVYGSMPLIMRQASETKAVIVTVAGDDSEFIGLLMPVRLPDGQSFTKWDDIYAPLKPDVAVDIKPAAKTAKRRAS